jgi:SSS family solute:Na+ symporter
MVALWQKGVISSLLYAYTIFTSGIVIPVIAGFYKDRLKINSWGALAAIIGGGGTGLVMKLLEKEPPLDLLGLGVCILLLFGVSGIIRIWSSHIR